MRGFELDRGASRLMGTAAVLTLPFRPATFLCGSANRCTSRESRLVFPAPDGPHRSTISPAPTLKFSPENNVVVSISLPTPKACWIFRVDFVRISGADNESEQFRT